MQGVWGPQLPSGTRFAACQPIHSLAGSADLVHCELRVCLQITSLLVLVLKQLPDALAQFESHVRLFR